jgi:hypothetical protein
MINQITDNTDRFDSCSDWVMQGENYQFANAPSITLMPTEWHKDGSVTFDIVHRTGEGTGEIINTFTFKNYPGMETLGHIARLHAGTTGSLIYSL